MGFLNNTFYRVGRFVLSIGHTIIVGWVSKRKSPIQPDLLIWDGWTVCKNRWYCDYLFFKLVGRLEKNHKAIFGPSTTMTVLLEQHKKDLYEQQ